MTYEIEKRKATSKIEKRYKLAATEISRLIELEDMTSYCPLSQICFHLFENQSQPTVSLFLSAFLKLLYIFLGKLFLRKHLGPAVFIGFCIEH